MRPKEPPATTPDDLFRARLSNIINPRHELVRLAQLIDWRMFETAFGPLYAEVGRPGLPTRLLVGLHLLKHIFNLSDEVVCAGWVENPYYQHFCGFDYFQYELPIDRSSMTRWRERIGPGGMEVLLKATIEAGLDGGVVAPKDLERVTVDTTVQPKAVAHPSDARLYHRGREILVRLAAKHGLGLRQSYARLGKRALRKAGAYLHARQNNRAKREIKRLKTFLGRVSRDIRRKLAGNQALAPHFARALVLVDRLLAQQRHDTRKLYSLHAPEVECLAKGKAHKKYEFGVKVSVAVTNRSGFVLGMMALPGNPYDGHTLQTAAGQVVSSRLAHGLLGLDLPVYGGEPGPDFAHIVCVGDVLSEQHDSTSHASLQDLYAFLTAHGVKLSIRRGILRFSFHVYNDESDVERTLSLVKAWRDAHSTGKRRFEQNVG